MATKNYCNLEDLTVYDEEIKSYIGSHANTYTANVESGIGLHNYEFNILMIPINHGGTGALNSTTARKNLGALSYAYGTTQQGEPINVSGQNLNEIWYEKYE